MGQHRQMPARREIAEDLFRDHVDLGKLRRALAKQAAAPPTVAAADCGSAPPVAGSVGGAMSWGAPKTLMPFGEESPFYGLAVPEEVTVTAQVLAQPDPELAGRTIAALRDGTPLVTRKALGEGQVVLVHVTANAEWSNLPLSGLFMSMLERLAVAAGSARPDAGALEGTTWVAEELIDGFGAGREAGTMAGVPLGPEQ